MSSVTCCISGAVAPNGVSSVNNDLMGLEDEGRMFVQNIGNQLPNNAVSIPQEWNPQLCYCENLKTSSHLKSGAAKLSK